MTKYLHKFNTEQEYNNKRKKEYIEPWVSLILENEKIDYNSIISFALVTRYVDGKPSTYNNLPRYARVYFQTYEGANPSTGTLISEEDVTTSCTWRWAWDVFSTYACKDEPQHTNVERAKYNTDTHQEETGEWDTVKFISLGVPQQTMLCTSEPWEFKYVHDNKEYTSYFWPTWSWV